MEQYFYKERVYSDLENLYKNNKKDNLVTLNEFKENVNKKGMSIDEALSHRELSHNEIRIEELTYSYGFRRKLLSPMLIMVSVFTSALLTVMYYLLLYVGFDGLQPYLNAFLFFILSYLFFLIPTSFDADDIKGRKEIVLLEYFISQEHRRLEDKIQEELKLI